MTLRDNATNITTPSDREIVITRTVAAPRRIVFEAYTKPEHVVRWLLGPPGWTMPVCEIDLRPGGEWHYIWRSDDGDELEMRGVYREIVPPEQLVSTQSHGEMPDSLNTLVLSEENGKTRITQRVLYASRQARDAALKTGMADGLAAGYQRLDEYLATLA